MIMLTTEDADFVAKIIREYWTREINELNEFCDYVDEKFSLDEEAVKAIETEFGKELADQAVPELKEFVKQAKARQNEILQKKIKNLDRAYTLMFTGSVNE